ncbi:MAG TPA: hypothetical protein VGC91_10530 [Pyrinomonadaceae bacterium]|jgi:hypothetical protein
MKPPLRVSFNSPQSGFMSIGLKAGERAFVIAVSHTPYDSLADLIKALTALLEGEKSLTVKWNREPEEYDFELLRDEDQTRLSVTRYPNHRRLKSKSEQVFSHTAATPLDICEPFWRALRELHRDINVDEFDKNWRREFPETEMQELTKRLREFKHRMTS